MAKLKLQNISTKAAGSAVVKYREMRKAGLVPAIALFDKLSKFYGKKGQVLKRETRYQTSLNKLQELVKEMQRDYGKTPGKKNIKKKGEEVLQRITKEGKGYAKQHGAKDNRFTRVAREQSQKYFKMTQVFASETYTRLQGGAYGIGSGVVQAMIDQGWSDDDAITFLRQIKEVWDKDIPEAARKLASSDEMWQTVMEMTEIMQQGGVEAEEFKAIFKGYISADDQEDFKEAVKNYADQETDIPFSQVWEKLKDYNNIADPKNMEEVIDELSEG